MHTKGLGGAGHAFYHPMSLLRSVWSTWSPNGKFLRNRTIGGTALPSEESTSFDCFERPIKCLSEPPKPNTSISDAAEIYDVPVIILFSVSSPLHV